jgi:hypothetical protein
MTLGPFPIKALKLSDYDLGAYLLWFFAAVRAENLGLPVDRMTEAFIGRIRQQMPTQETSNVKDAALEKALHKAASGDFEAAGKFLREHMIGGAVTMKFVPIGIKFTEGRKSNTGGPIRKAIARLLKRNHDLKNPEIWAFLKSKPPKGWDFLENSAGKYIEGPKMKNMNYQRFCNVCGEERKKIEK